MSKTKLRKKVFQPTQVDKLVFKVQDLSEEPLALDEAYEGLHRDIDRLERLVGILQSKVNELHYCSVVCTTSASQPAQSTTTFASDFNKGITTKPWWKRWLGR